MQTIQCKRSAVCAEERTDTALCPSAVFFLTGEFCVKTGWGRRQERPEKKKGLNNARAARMFVGIYGQVQPKWSLFLPPVTVGLVNASACMWGTRGQRKELHQTLAVGGGGGCSSGGACCCAQYSPSMLVIPPLPSLSATSGCLNSVRARTRSRCRPQACRSMDVMFQRHRYTEQILLE